MALFTSTSFHFNVANASDPPPLQDFCVGEEDPNSAVFVNGMLCKNPKKVTAQDFLYKGFNITGNTNNKLHANATLIDVDKLPSLNTQGVAIAHIDFGPHGLNTPHHHPRSSEIFALLTGKLYASFITSEYELFSVVLNPGDLFVFPQGLIHFQYNLKKSPARAIATFGSQRPGRVNSAQGLFEIGNLEPFPRRLGVNRVLHVDDAPRRLSSGVKHPTSRRQRKHEES
ncbi:hypothetical protein RND81_06G059700 [Saponaria officinalis]|uniref:Germin-like protein n=1 Tax=Saponaria officinalis TaxID=3572 RepID=A0AAW1K4E8_SAPOF